MNKEYTEGYYWSIITSTYNILISEYIDGFWYSCGSDVAYTTEELHKYTECVILGPVGECPYDHQK